MSGEATGRPAWLLALGRRRPAGELRVDGRDLRLEQVYKHDFFAHTARYGDERGAVLVKRARRGLALGWLGRVVTWHEARIYRRLAGLDGIPRLLASPAPGVLLHEHLAGRALAWGERTPDGFLERLEELVARVHARDVAIVDLEKPGNVLLGDDGSPALFDFQLAWYWPRNLGGGLAPARWLLAEMQRGDRYHLGKLRRRLRPDTLSSDQIAASRRRPGLVGLATRLFDPVRRLRRRFLRRVEPDHDAPGERGRIAR
ncbi:MAG: hypothetical protein WD226_05130 [Planctomycetota bacterium]